MKLKKLVKKILKEKKEKGSITDKRPYTGPRKDGIAHLYSGCMLSDSTAGFDYDGFAGNTIPWAHGNSFSTGIITQLYGSGHSYGQQGYLGEFEDIQNLEGMDLTAGIINNNNIIHDMWGLTSPGQVVKFHTSPLFINLANPISNAGNYGVINRGVCMKYEGPVGVGFTDLDGSPLLGSISDYPIHTYPHFHTLDVVEGTFSSCEECEQFANGGLPTYDYYGNFTDGQLNQCTDPDACNYMTGNVNDCWYPGDNCSYWVSGEYVDGSYVPPYTVYGTWNWNPSAPNYDGNCECILNDTQDLPTNDDSDKDSQVSRMQDLANIKPKK